MEESTVTAIVHGTVGKSEEIDLATADVHSLVMAAETVTLVDGPRVIRIHMDCQHDAHMIVSLIEVD